MKRILFTCAMLSQLSLFAANSLLQNPATGTVTFPASTIPTIGIIANNTDVALALGVKGAVYIVDIQDNNTTEAAANTITSVPDFVTAKLNAVAGANVFVKDMVVNPKSKSVYILAATMNGAVYLFKVKNNGASVSLVSLNNVSYSKINLAANTETTAITWGNNTLYVSAASSTGTTLAAEVDWMVAHFANNSSFTKRNTSMFKSNWGNAYMTNAPLEQMTFGTVAGKKRIMGVTTCAPGYSVDVANLTGNGTLQVTEDFNVHDGKTWLYDLHDFDMFGGDGKLYRIGQKFLDGSQVAAGQHNGNAVTLRNFDGTPTAGLAESDFKGYTDKVNAIAYWDDGKMLKLYPSGVNGGALRLETMGVPPAGTGIASMDKQDFAFKLFPNPASGKLNVDLGENNSKSNLEIMAIDGRSLLQQTINGSKSQLDISSLQPGNYILMVTLANGLRSSNRFVVK